MNKKSALEAVAEELHRRHRAGEETVCVSDAALQALHQMRQTASGFSDPAPGPTGGPAITEATATATVPEIDTVAATLPEAPLQVKSGGRAEADPPKLPPAPSIRLPEGDAQARSEWLRKRVLNCPVCLSHTKPGKQVVYGTGNIEADLFFCGEAPGAEEEASGEPFVGPAGQLLTRIIEAMGLTRDEVYIANIMNWRPDNGQSFGNRPPTREEMDFCLPYLRAQIAVVQPRVIVALGATAVKGLKGLDQNPRMGQVRGRWDDCDGIPLMVTYHPSYLLRNQSKARKREVWEDMLLVMERLEMEISEKQRRFFL